MSSRVSGLDYACKRESGKCVRRIVVLLRSNTFLGTKEAEDRGGKASPSTQVVK